MLTADGVVSVCCTLSVVYTCGVYEYWHALSVTCVHMLNCAQYEPRTQSNLEGGIQGGEGVTGGEAWYIENVLEELDSEREWVFDTPTSTLYYKPNATEVDVNTGAPTGAFVATNLKVLFNITGTMQAPAHHVAIQGVTLRDTVYTYFDPHGLPSGGDWALQKQGKRCSL